MLCSAVLPNMISLLDIGKDKALLSKKGATFMDLEIEHIDLFKYSIYQCYLPHIKKYNQEIIQKILDLEKIVKKNYKKEIVGGQSNPDLFHRIKGFEELEKAFIEAIAKIVKVSQKKIICVRSWAFVATQKEFILFDNLSYRKVTFPSYQTGIHNHSPFHFSGVYYVSFPFPKNLQEDQYPNALLQFFNPITTGLNQKDWEAIQPEEGLLVIFPSLLNHRVVPFDGPGERISISMDALILD